MRAVLFDCDDVLLDWLGGFKAFANTRLGREVVGEPRSWFMGEWLGTTDEIALELIREFNESPGFGKLRSVWGARHAVELLSVTPGIRLHVITSCSSDQATVALRRANLEHEFGRVFDSIHCLDLGEPKRKILQAFAPGSIWIEDNYKNALQGLEVGHNVYIRERPHNFAFQAASEPLWPRVQWFSDYRQLLETF